MRPSALVSLDYNENMIHLIATDHRTWDTLQNTHSGFLKRN